MTSPEDELQRLRSRVAELEAKLARRTLAGWSEPEDAIVRNGYGHGYRLATIRAELIATGHRVRTFGNISGRAQLLGCTSSKRTSWSPEEDAILRAGYADSVSTAELRKRLRLAGFPRGIASIGQRCFRLGLNSKQSGAWTEDEVRRLRARFGDRPSALDVLAQVADELGRSPGAVKTKLAQLRIRRRVRRAA